MTEPVVWREWRELTSDLFRCDLCGEQATTIHLVPWCGDECERALFACEIHDPGGYWLNVADWIGDRDKWVRHLEEKLDPRRSVAEHPGGLCLLLDREDELRRPVVAASGAAEREADE